MTSRINDDAAVVGVAAQPTAERITIGLIPKVQQELQRLQRRTSLSKTDIVNRAITLYEFLDARHDDDVLIRNRDTGETLVIQFL